MHFIWSILFAAIVVLCLHFYSCSVLIFKYISLCITIVCSSSSLVIFKRSISMDLSIYMICFGVLFSCTFILHLLLLLFLLSVSVSVWLSVSILISISVTISLSLYMNALFLFTYVHHLEQFLFNLFFFLCHDSQKIRQSRLSLCLF